MKMIIVALALVAAVAAAPVEDKKVPQIIRSDYTQQTDGSFVSVVETENGIKTQTTGELKTVTNEEGKQVTVLVIRGTYEYPRDDGTSEVVNFSGDENGYNAQGPSIPVAPAARR